MTATTQLFTESLKRYLKHSFRAIEREQRMAADMVGRLEPKTRESLINQYGPDDAWRGLCSDDVQLAFDLIRGLDSAVSSEQPQSS